jgi:hypothetical protein
MDDITDLIEQIARQGYAEHGRGWVLVMAGEPPLLSYVSSAAWPDFLRQWQIDDHRDMDVLLNGYEPRSEYLVLMVQIAHLTPVRIRYRAAAPPMA